MADLENGFRKLCNLDRARRANYLEKELDDKTHFIHAVEEDIISNAISLAMDLKYIKPDTIGMASSGRSILEAFVLLRAAETGKIPEENLARFRDEHIFIEYANSRHLMEALPESVDKSSWLQLEQDYQRLSQKYCQELEMSPSEFRRFSKDPMFILFRKGTHTLKSFNDLMHKYYRDRVNDYQFLGMVIHPHFLMTWNLVDKERKQVRELCYSIFSEAMAYLKRRYPDEMETGNAKTLTDTINEPEVFSPWFSHLTNQIRWLADFSKKFARNGDISDGYTLYFMEKMTYLYYSMESMAILGFREHSVIKFKSALENIACFYHINKTGEKEDNLEIQKKAFNISSELQYVQLLPDKGKYLDTLLKNLKSVYDSYYQAKYVIPYEEFEVHVLHNGKYVLSKDDNYSYRQMVLDFLGDFPQENSFDQKQILALYDTSLDMEHAGGYLMESSIGPWQSFYFPIMNYLHTFFGTWMEVGIQIKKQWNMPVDKLEMDYFSFMKDVEFVNLARGLASSQYR